MIYYGCTENGFFKPYSPTTDTLTTYKYSCRNTSTVALVPIAWVCPCERIGGLDKERLDSVRNGINNNSPLPLIKANQQLENGFWMIDNGNHRLQVAIELSFTHIPVDVINPKSLQLRSSPVMFKKQTERIEGSKKYVPPNRRGNALFRNPASSTPTVESPSPLRRSESAICPNENEMQPPKLYWPPS